ncbi:hypothetical protein NDU88_002335 [Pleurodeles waltl]|uniref:Uncharacterized protein n=1 Tax=Pleurodeles waltl TaxID=8319 RepID=A0AAV7PDQ9_PLEWA|nr:hypothetical protein NDU88_002335 [Pleurodeles waltl]
MTLPNLEQIIENKWRALQAVATMATTTVDEDDDKGLHIFITDDETNPSDDSQWGSLTPLSVTPATADTLK